MPPTLYQFWCTIQLFTASEIFISFHLQFVFRPWKLKRTVKKFTDEETIYLPGENVRCWPEISSGLAQFMVDEIVCSSSLHLFFSATNWGVLPSMGWRICPQTTRVRAEIIASISLEWWTLQNRLFASDRSFPPFVNTGFIDPRFHQITCRFGYVAEVLACSCNSIPW